jgi:hypothetical protein
MSGLFPTKSIVLLELMGLPRILNILKKSQTDILRKNGFFGKYEIHGHKILRDGVERRFIDLEFS